MNAHWGPSAKPSLLLQRAWRWTIDSCSTLVAFDERSPQGARAWLRAYDDLIERMQKQAHSFGPAYENDDCEFDVRQALFKTRRGRVYRVLFFIEGEEVYILRVRGPGQAPVEPDELGVD